MSLLAAFNGFLAPYPLRRLEIEEVKFLTQLMFSSDLAGLHTALLRQSGYAIIHSRMPEGTADTQAIAFMAQVCSSPGHCVMAAFTLFRISRKLGGKLVTLRDLTNGPFANGVPDVDAPAWRDLWEAQKDGGANLLDTTAWV
jgi:hypothetical protein